MKLDFSQIPDFKALPEGEYDAVVSQVTVKESSNSEYPYLNWQFTISDTDFPEAESMSVYMMTSLSPKALWRVRDTFATFGLIDSEIDLEIDDTTGILIDPDLTGMAVRLQLSQDTYQNQIRNRVEQVVQVYHPLGGAASTMPATEDDSEAKLTQPKLL